MQISSLLSVDVTTEVLSKPLEGITDLSTETKLSDLLIPSPANVPRYDALLHIHLESGLMRIDVEAFQAQVAKAIATANSGMFVSLLMTLLFHFSNITFHKRKWMNISC